jgi:dTMP kinase
MPGRFITFEGGEGTGKSTQVARLAARLAASGSPPVVVREPGGTPLAEGIRNLLLDSAQAMEPMAEVFLLEAARTDLVAKVIRPALAEGRIVLCDRYADSTLAYQGGGRGLDRDLLRTLNRAATGGLRPDLTVLYDLDPRVGLERRGSAAGLPNRLDREPLEFHQRVRAEYRRLAAEEPERFAILDATLPPEVLEAGTWDRYRAVPVR